MLCHSCSFENPEGMKFCGECGSPLTRRCPNCQSENPPAFKFCGECGTSLKEQGCRGATGAGEQRVQGSNGCRGEFPNPQSHEAERRQVSVMFCDLVGSTALSQQIDAEDLREMFLAYREQCAYAIHRNGGQIAKSFGDGLMVYFGYPIAYEDNPQRAIRAGLGIIALMEQLNVRLILEKGVKLDVRIGIHTGRAVVGEMGSGDIRELMDIVGDTPNIAARIQGVAAPNTVAISTPTYRMTRGYFECESLGHHALKGVSQPMEVYRVLHENPIRTRLETSPSSLTPFVGRELEQKTLLQLWQQVKEGNGQVVLLSGDAGKGKSRLVQVFKERIAAESHALRELYCSPYYENTTFYPITDILRGRRMQLGREDSPEEKLAKLEQFLAEHEWEMAVVVPLFANLLSIPMSGRYAPLNLSPLAQKQKLLEVFLGMTIAIAAQQPLLFVCEDLHWIDPSTLEFLTLLIDQIADHRIFLLCTARPTFKSPWSERDYLTQIAIAPLDDAETEIFVKVLTGGKALPEEVLNLVVEKSDRLPLFIEEMTKMVLESGWLTEGESAYELNTLPLLNLAIPSSLQDLLMSRLDRLTEAKKIAQIAAIIGREFSYELLEAISPMDRVTLQNGLVQLVEANLLFATGEDQAAKYIFKHALIQDAAYESLLKSTRKRYHQQIALVLEKQFPDPVENEPELLAYHYTRAGLKEQAIRYWYLAGQKAVKSSANVEAIAHLTKGLELLETIPDTPERIQLELDLQTTLGPALITTIGYAAPEVGQTYKRSKELCKQIGETPQLFWVLYGLWAFYVVRTEHQTALEFGHQLMSLAELEQNKALALQSYNNLGNSLFFIGELTAAHQHLEQAIALYDSHQHHSLVLFTGLDTGVACRIVTSLTLWLKGFAQQALAHSHAAIALSSELSHPYSMVSGLNFAAVLHQYRREGQAVIELAEAGITLSSDQGFAFWGAWGTILRGWALTELGLVEEGIAQMRSGIAAYRATGAELFLPYFQALLAEGYMKVGQFVEGMNVLAQALARVEKTGERYWEAELYRLKGELLLEGSRGVQEQGSRGAGEQGSRGAGEQGSRGALEVEDCFRQAIAISRRQGAKSLELRAAMSLARLWQQQGKQEQARELLAEIYGWFTEGFDTADLKDALTLITEL